MTVLDDSEVIIDTALEVEFRMAERDLVRDLFYKGVEELSDLVGAHELENRH